MKVYVSGPMSGVPENNFPAFNEAAAELRRLGFAVVNPAELGEHADWVWADYLKRDLKVLLNCDVVFALPGWRDSRGASLECDVASRLSMPVFETTAGIHAYALNHGGTE